MNLQETMIWLSRTRHKKILARGRPPLHWRRTSSCLVRIVAPPSPRYGVEMKPAGLSATLVVRLRFFFDFLRTGAHYCFRVVLQTSWGTSAGRDEKIYH